MAAGQLTCQYCGSRQEIDLHGIPYTDLESPTNMQCPACEATLQSIRVDADESITLEKCPKCCGLFFNPGELEYLLVKQIPVVLNVDYDRLNSLREEASANRAKNRYRRCPYCSQPMSFINYQRKSGVIVDWCREHGLWLDGGELRQLLEWRKAGGMKALESGGAHYSLPKSQPSPIPQPAKTRPAPRKKVNTSSELDRFRHKKYDIDTITSSLDSIFNLFFD